eukprot:scaffold155941_cov36-Prasinocladus_malaysianus.AAC.1
MFEKPRAHEKIQTDPRFFGSSFSLYRMTYAVGTLAADLASEAQHEQRYSYDYSSSSPARPPPLWQRRC